MTVPSRCSVDSGLPAAAVLAGAATELTTLQVAVAELQLSPDGAWLYVLNVAAGAARWQVLRRYSELRGFWQQLCELLSSEAAQACGEHCHFLQGLEADKFPKKRLLHTKTVLEARANDLDQCLLKLTMRLNLCSPRSVEGCRLRGCPLVALVAGFFEMHGRVVRSKARAGSAPAAVADPADGQQPEGQGRHPHKKLVKFRSIPLLKSHAGRQLSLHGRRLSFAELRDVQLVAPRAM